MNGGVVLITVVFYLVDYRPPVISRLEFEVGGNTTHCFTIEIISDIAYEGSKNFSAEITIVLTDRVVLIPQTVVRIIDYNGE